MHPILWQAVIWLHARFGPCIRLTDDFAERDWVVHPAGSDEHAVCV